MKLFFLLLAIPAAIFSTDRYNSCEPDRTPSIYNAIVDLKRGIDDRVRRATLLKPNSREFHELIGEVRGMCVALKHIENALVGNDCVTYIVEIFEEGE